MKPTQAITMPRKAWLLLLPLLAGLVWSLAHAAPAECEETVGMAHDQILLVLHNNGSEAPTPRLPAVTPAAR
ncbi:hypothetical protein GCM10025771_21220 [Niveibacterium umoris]|uniref:Uncharacterized protein n=1 Tax=Niveibacterium umoris TaxID=1193620 RepID=A0A840BM98_9RHOO|nr:hypothetical protein [Niveibacterium umoris]MBB4012688.1 hypothetical protein [Niveibacterium umoris]